MKKIYLLFILFCGMLNAQQITVKGFLKDAQTNEPIISASIGVKNTAIGTISNDEGQFQLSLPKNAAIVISFLGYKSVTIPASEFGSDVKTIVLENDEQILEEVIVSKITIEKLLQTLISSSVARFNKPIILHTYYREFVKLNGQYSKFSDGLLDYHISGSVKKNKSDLIVKQSRTVQLFKENPEDDMSQVQVYDNVQSGITRHYDFDEIKDLLDDYKNYEFEIKSRTDKNGKQLYAITFEPKAGKSVIEHGSITYDPETKLIFEIDVETIPNQIEFKERNYLLARLTAMNRTFKAVYKMSGNNYVLAYANSYDKVRIRNMKKTIDKIIESKSDIIVTDLNVDDLSYDKNEIYKKRDFYSGGNHYTEKFWLQNNSMVLTAEEQKVIESLEKDAVQTPK